MPRVEKTAIFDQFITNLKDDKAKIRILARIDRLSLGNFGDYKFLRDAVYELRVDVGKGYRIYFMKSGEEVVILLCAGDKKKPE